MIILVFGAGFSIAKIARILLDAVMEVEVIDARKYLTGHRE